jgi:uncharacterized GH25 family protein
MNGLVRKGRLGLLAGSAGFLIAASASAHDFWVQPDRFDHPPGALVTMTLQVGHGEDRQRSRIPRSRITRFAAIGPDGEETDLRAALDLGGSASDGAFRLSGEGAHMLVLETDSRAQSRLPADRFNRYLEEEGLTPAIELRRRTGRTDAEGTEIYGRRAKSIVLIGSPVPEAQVNITRPVGLTLEIVPEASPYTLPRASPLPVRVYYEGAPLTGALVKLTNLEDDAAPIAAQRTDGSGRTAFAIPRTGSWLLSVVWTRPLPPGNGTDFETVFSSLSFAILSD